LNVKAQHGIKSDFDISMKDTLLETNQIQIMCSKYILNCFYI